MKKYIYIFLFLFVILSSCGEKEHMPISDSDSTSVMTIVLDAGESMTTNVTKAGNTGSDNKDEDYLNTEEYENKITYASVFIFQKNVADDENTCLMRFVNCTCKEVPNTPGKFIIRLGSEMEKFKETDKFKLYVVANEDMTEFDEKPLNEVTLGTIKNHIIENSFDDFTTLKHFTMFGEGSLKIENINIQNKSKQKVTGTVNLQREANKVTVYIRKGDSLTNETIETVEVSLRDAVKRCRIESVYFPKEEDYFNSPYVGCKEYPTKEEEKYNQKSYKFHSINYFSYVKNAKEQYRRAEVDIIVGWADKTESKFKIYVSDNISYEKNQWYKIYVTIDTKGESSDPITLTPDGVQVLDWSEISNISGDLGDGLEGYLEVTQNHIVGFDDETVTANFKSSTPVDMNNIEIVKIEYIPLDYSKTGKTSDGRVALKGDAFTNFKGKCEIFKREQREENGEKDGYGYEGSFSFHRKEKPNVHEMLFYTRRFITIKLKTKEDKVGLETLVEIEVRPYIEIDFHKSDSRSVFVDGWRFPDTDNQGNNYKQCYNQNGDVLEDHWFVKYIKYVYTPYGHIARPYPSYFDYEPSPLDAIDVTENLVNFKVYSTKELNAVSSEKYYIGNSREKSSWNTKSLIPWSVRHNVVAPEKNKWTNASEIMVTSSSKEDFRQITAPSFLVSSLYAEVGDNQIMTYETAKKRAATYQEAGYPAGRWRLPTEAEMRAIFVVQCNEKLRGSAFKGKYILMKGRWYFLADGRYAYWDYDAADKPVLHFGKNEDAHAKLVYDTWVWGQDPVYTGEDIYNYEIRISK